MMSNGDAFFQSLLNDDGPMDMDMDDTFGAMTNPFGSVDMLSSAEYGGGASYPVLSPLAMMRSTSPNVPEPTLPTPRLSNLDADNDVMMSESHAHGQDPAPVAARQRSAPANMPPSLYGEQRTVSLDDVDRSTAFEQQLAAQQQLLGSSSSAAAASAAAPRRSTSAKRGRNSNGHASAAEVWNQRVNASSKRPRYQRERAYSEASDDGMSVTTSPVNQSTVPLPLEIATDVMLSGQRQRHAYRVSSDGGNVHVMVPAQQTLQHPAAMDYMSRADMSRVKTSQRVLNVPFDKATVIQLLQVLPDPRQLLLQVPGRWTPRTLDDFLSVEDHALATINRLGIAVPYEANTMQLNVREVVYDSMPFGVYILPIQYGVSYQRGIYVNDRLCQILGYEKDELLSIFRTRKVSFQTIFPVELADTYYREMAAMVGDRIEKWSSKCVYVHKSGTHIPCIVSRLVQYKQNTPFTLTTFVQVWRPHFTLQADEVPTSAC